MYGEGYGMGEGYGFGGRGGMHRMGMNGRHSGMHRGFIGLKFWILSLLSNNEMTGAQISDVLEDWSMGRWRPSPGNIYPALKELESLGYIKRREENTQKYYSITDEGRKFLEEFGRFPGFGARYGNAYSDIDEALENLYRESEYLQRNSGQIKSSEATVKKLKEIIEKLEGVIS